jgi:translocation and assembly module TamB
LTLYSEPAQSDADTLSWLITGRPISGASSEEAGLLAQAALSLGAEQSSILTNEIENLFRLDEFSVGAGSTVNDTSVSAAKRISPNLTFRSSFNPFNQLWSFLVNYRLTDHWSVQSESGISQGADIIYSIETNTFSELFDKLWQFNE